MPTTTLNKPESMNTKPEIKGELTYEDKVLQKIVGLCLEDIKGLLNVDGGFFANVADKLVNTNDVTSGVDVEVGKKQVAVDLNIVAEYGIDIPNLYDQIKRKIVENVDELTGLDVIEVNVTVTDVKTHAEYERDSVSVQDKVGELSNKTKHAVGKGAQKTKSAVSTGVDKVTPDNEPSRVQ
ncbi:Asp23/Gls24 family envelope stress response protein [Lactobacillus sp. LC28-10]|uniref:Stress response regulator gls24 homolog n=1 Tax=Secundilactobacillus angelensis TaxID=2722706 RepID=A0ABX1KVJ6_9LACO|nr:Asp23/Gls24 family envelope stress response protein [Secundilactobacillus angelensis]MCH5461632.1 Asp23/Gls24 family envelope stress response protein [Secundilactobacillus angelensis]NLR17927.1 Asp23/Gls24 family envelope stress response protein [Secundilactobacillus angelensis]